MRRDVALVVGLARALVAGVVAHLRLGLKLGFYYTNRMSTGVVAHLRPGLGSRNFSTLYTNMCSHKYT